MQGPKLNTGFEVQPHQCPAQGNDHCPCVMEAYEIETNNLFKRDLFYEAFSLLPLPAITDPTTTENRFMMSNEIVTT